MEQTASETNPKVGVAVFIMKDGKFIMGRRRGAHGTDTWGLPGGHLEFGESWEDCVARETLEETDLQIKNTRYFTATNDIFNEDSKHYITIFMVADWANGIEKIMEPEKCSELAWFTYEKMPNNLFLPLKNLQKMHQHLL